MNVKMVGVTVLKDFKILGAHSTDDYGVIEMDGKQYRVPRDSEVEIHSDGIYVEGKKVSPETK